jgi:hypothetical protein
MMSNTDNKIAEFLSDIESVSVEHADIINHVRTLFLNGDSTIDETIKYGGLIFIKQGNFLGGIFSYQNHLSLEFSKGAELDDPHGVLEGKGKYRRHIKFKSFNDISTKHASMYIDNILRNS